MKKYSTKKTVSIGIPAYQSEENIGQLLKSLTLQSEHQFKIIEILVYSDGNTDKTASKAMEVKDRKKRITVINAKKRMGMSHGFKHMLKKAKGDIFVLLNDDILIKNKNFVKEIVQPFLKDEGVGLVSGNPQPLSPKNFIQKAGISTFRAYERTRYSFSNGHNKMTCDGKALALSRNFWNKIKFPRDNASLGNVDAYLYFSSLTADVKYRHARRANVYFEFPYTSAEYLKWTSRNNSNKFILRKQFGSIVDTEYRIPIVNHIQSLIIESAKNPIGALYMYIVGIVARNRAQAISQNFNPTWEVVTTTKKRLG